MRVLLDTTYSRRAPFSGTAVYLERLAQALAATGEVEVIEAADERRAPPAGGGLGSVRNLMRDSWWGEVELPRLAVNARADVIHHPLPARARGAHVPQVATVADVAFERVPECFDVRFRAYARKAHKAAARRCDAVICISRTTEADVRELWKVPEERIVVAPLGPGQEIAGAPDAERAHLLYVGDDEPRKNLPVLLEAYGRYREQMVEPLPLVLAGSATGDGPGIVAEHRPGRERLAELYAGAVALVHPSLYEGFGLTPLEAMSAGTPVVAGRSPGVEEVCGDAARYADPRDPVALASAIAEVTSSPELRRELAERGRRQVDRYSWARCARAHATAYSLARARA
ncbi:MAG TPA: glycosyltransferase family 1 protein [Solirubrobacteraceae bacterium]